MTDGGTVFARSTFFGPSSDGQVEVRSPPRPRLTQQLTPVLCPFAQLELLWCSPELQQQLVSLPSLTALLVCEGSTEAVMKGT
jgi:hypothetical protein